MSGGNLNWSQESLLRLLISPVADFLGFSESMVLFRVFKNCTINWSTINLTKTKPALRTDHLRELLSHSRKSLVTLDGDMRLLIGYNFLSPSSPLSFPNLKCLRVRDTDIWAFRYLNFGPFLSRSNEVVDDRSHCQIRRLTLENSGRESEINPGFHPAVFNSCPELEYLNLNNIGLRFTPGVIVGVNLQEIVLTSVTINRFDFLVPCSKLRRLTFEQVNLTENQPFDFSSPILEYLRIINCDNFSCDSQEGRFPNLIELRLEDAELANVGFIEQLVSLRWLTLQCPQAESLNLGRLVFVQRVELIYHHGGLVLGHHPILTELIVTGNCASLLDLTGCLALTTLTLYGLPIERLDGLRNCRQLVKLDLTFCQYIKSIAVIENFPLLEEIVLDFSSDITNFDSLALCHNLRKISLEWTDITSVDKLASLPRLDWLNLRECRNITIRHPLFNDGKLKYLDLTKTGL